MKHILLIGGEGYIGNIVTEKLLSSDCKVTSFDNLLYKNNLCVLNKIQNPNYQFIYGDMLVLQLHIRMSLYVFIHIPGIILTT